MTYSQVGGLFRAFAGQPGGGRYLGAGRMVDKVRMKVVGDLRCSRPHRQTGGSRTWQGVSASTYPGKTAEAT